MPLKLRNLRSKAKHSHKRTAKVRSNPLLQQIRKKSQWYKKCKSASFTIGANLCL